MTGTIDVVKAISYGLEREVKKALTEELVRKALEDYEAKVRERIKPIVESVTMKSVDTLRDAMRMRDELVVSLSWEEKVNG